MQAAPAIYRAVYQAMQAGVVRACHDLSEGGLAVTAAEMCIGGRLGMTLTIDDDDAIETLFGEANGRLLVEVRANECAVFETYVDQLPSVALGKVTAEPRLIIQSSVRPLISLSVDDLVTTWSQA
jgi:phosphoribosylformylglycinamidine synthase